MILDLPERFVTVDIKINGERIQAPVVTDLTIDEIGEDLDMVAAQMGYWSNVWAEAQEILDAADASYRSWRGNMGMKILEDEPKLAEWKVKDLVDASPQFLEHKAKIARAQKHVNICRGLFDAFAKKANVLQSRGANEREQLARTGAYVKGDPETRHQDNEARQVERQQRADKVRGIFSRKKRKRKGEPESEPEPEVQE